MGFKTYAPAYLSPHASGKNLLIGANFASAASGYDENAATLNVSLEWIINIWFYFTRILILTISFIPFLAARDSVVPTVELFQGIPRQAGQGSWQQKSSLNYQGCTVCAQCWKQWLCAKLLCQSLDQQSLHSWSVFVLLNWFILKFC